MKREKVSRAREPSGTAPAWWQL